jgi:hypothetical protein
MRAASVMILKVCQQHTAQVTLVEDDDVIETVAPDRADDALDIGVLPGRSRCGDDLRDRHRLNTIAEGLAIRGVAVSQQKSSRGVPGEGLGDLARQPALCRVLGDLEMDDPELRHRGRSHVMGPILTISSGAPRPTSIAFSRARISRGASGAAAGQIQVQY